MRAFFSPLLAFWSLLFFFTPSSPSFPPPRIVFPSFRVFFPFANYCTFRPGFGFFFKALFIGWAKRVSNTPTSTRSMSFHGWCFETPPFRGFPALSLRSIFPLGCVSHFTEFTLVPFFNSLIISPTSLSQVLELYGIPLVQVARLIPPNNNLRPFTPKLSVCGHPVPLFFKTELPRILREKKFRIRGFFSCSHLFPSFLFPFFCVIGHSPTKFFALW